MDSCGWHMGADLFTDLDKHSIKINSELKFSKVYFIDSATLGKVPSTTVASLFYGRSKALAFETIED